MPKKSGSQRSASQQSQPSSPAHPTRSRVDLQEYAPRRFLIHNSQLIHLIKSEGIINGARFELTGWRREGMLARLAMQGFVTLTLADQIEELPTLPPAEPVGEPCPRALSSRERFSFFDPVRLTWAAVEPPAPEQRQVLLRIGWIVRRRRGRGTADYYRVMRERNGSAGLAALDETAALLAGYAQAAEVERPPLEVQRSEQRYQLPPLVLPPPYQQLFRRLGEHTKAWQVDEDGWPLARLLYQRLGLPLCVND